MRYVTLPLLLLISSLAYSQSIDRITDSKLLAREQVAGQKVVILFESDTLIVSVTLATLTRHFTDWLRLNPHLKEDKILFNKIQAKSKNSVIRADSIAKALKLEDRLKYRAGDLLSSGKCWAYNKLTRREQKTIRVIDYSDSFTVCRKYMLGNIVVLDNVLAVY